MMTEEHKKERRDIKRLKKAKAQLVEKVEDLCARNDGLRRRIDRLAAVLSEYACECPDYVRWDCNKRACGRRAADVLDEG